MSTNQNQLLKNAQQLINQLDDEHFGQLFTTLVAEVWDDETKLEIERRQKNMELGAKGRSWEEVKSDILSKI